MQQIPEFRLLNNYSCISFGLTDFVKGEIGEEEYINTRKDSNGRIILPWPELIYLKSDMRFYANYLLRFSLYGRRLVLLEDEVTGFSKQQLYDFYGVPNDTIGRYLGRNSDKKQKTKHTEQKTKNKKRKKHPPKLRDITNNQKVSYEVVAFFAILSRVPISWLEEEKPELKWNVYHFNYLHERSRMSLSGFKNYLENFPIEIDHDVDGIIINSGIRYPLYLRVEWLSGGFIIEVFNPNCGPSEIIPLVLLLQQFNCELGYMDTVIDSQKNYVFICKYKRNTPLCLPMEYRKLSTL